MEAPLRTLLKKRYPKSFPQPLPVRIARFKRHDLLDLFNELGFKKGAEVGVAEGRFSEAMCKQIPGVELISTDCWCAYDENSRSRLIGQNEADKRYAEAKEKLEPYGVKIIKGFSVEVSKSVPDGSLDFVYIDAGHDFDNVIMDIIHWSRKVRPGGIVSGHDAYRFRWAGVVEAVEAYTRAHSIQDWYLTGDREASFFWMKDV